MDEYHFWFPTTHSHLLNDYRKSPVGSSRAAKQARQCVALAECHPLVEGEKDTTNGAVTVMFRTYGKMTLHHGHQYQTGQRFVPRFLARSRRRCQIVVETIPPVWPALAVPSCVELWRMAT